MTIWRIRAVPLLRTIEIIHITQITEKQYDAICITIYIGSWTISTQLTRRDRLHNSRQSQFTLLHLRRSSMGTNSRRGHRRNTGKTEALFLFFPWRGETGHAFMRLTRVITQKVSQKVCARSTEKTLLAAVTRLQIQTLFSAAPQTSTKQRRKQQNKYHHKKSL